MPKKKVAKTHKMPITLDEREEVVNLLSKISSEGLHYYFTAYAGTRYMEGMGFLPNELLLSARGFIEAAERLEAEIETLMDKYGIAPIEVEY